MTTALALLSAVGGYLLTMAVLLFASGFLRGRFVALGMFYVQPYRALLKLTIIGTAIWAGYAILHAMT